MNEWKCSYKACECSSDAEKSECDLAYKTKKMSEEELKILEKQLSHFIKWLANNRPYKEGLLYGDMKDYLARLNQNKEDE